MARPSLQRGSRPGVAVENNYIHTERSGSSKMNSGLGVHIVTSSRVLVQGNPFERNETSVYGYNTGHSIRIIGNYLVDPLVPFPVGSTSSSGPATGGTIGAAMRSRVELWPAGSGAGVPAGRDPHQGHAQHREERTSS
jgi:hypothetical protein